MYSEHHHHLICHEDYGLPHSGRLHRLGGGAASLPVPLIVARATEKPPPWIAACRLLHGGNSVVAAMGAAEEMLPSEEVAEEQLVLLILDQSNGVDGKAYRLQRHCITCSSHGEPNYLYASPVLCSFPPSPT
ncbi:hypothetical protein OPV22_000379 [Ensete ventricosum]|uniref:Uncharacterized protein n=1 Tax=Ensete ventricosum TaxID=4639 RepID=A0AAV8QAK0_ENSVE|nr:hypothetical protein OPV22_000379 [Ensete ventricosum]